MGTTAQRRLRDRRRDEVDRAVADVGDRMQHLDGAARIALAGLRARLAKVHAHCEHVDERDWADYRARLDAGLAELEAERTRAFDDAGTRAGPPDVMLFPLVARLELDGWRVRLAALAALDTHLLPGGATRERRDDIHPMLDTVSDQAPEPIS